MNYPRKHILYGCLILIMQVFALPLFGMSKQDSVFKEKCAKLDLPILYIITQDSVMPTYTAVEAPPGCDGVGITNNEKVPGRMVIVLNEDTLYDTGEYKKDTSGLTIKVRGNTSASTTSTEKKPYKIKLQKKKDLLFRGNEKVYADKEWVLLRKSICENIVGNIVNRDLGMDWTPAQQPVFVFLNDNFRGVYMLTECVKRNNQCRVNISKDGFLFEYDAYWWNENYYIESRYKYNYTLKYPESDEILPEQETYLTNHLQIVESHFAEPQQLDSVIDIHSYARWLWVHDMIGTFDGGGVNMFLVKNDQTTESKQAMICAWDFDSGFYVGQKWSAAHNLWWFKEFFAIPQTEFVNEYISMYDAQVADLYDTLVNTIDSLLATPFVSSLDEAYVLEKQRWSDNSQSAHQQLTTIRNYLAQRKANVALLMEELKANYNVATSIKAATFMDTQKSRAFDMLGRPIQETTPFVFTIIHNNDGTVTKRIIAK